MGMHVGFQEVDSERLFKDVYRSRAMIGLRRTVQIVLWGEGGRKTGVSFKENRRRKAKDSIDDLFQGIPYKEKGRNGMIVRWEVKSRDFIFLRVREIPTCQW